MRVHGYGIVYLSLCVLVPHQLELSNSAAAGGTGNYSKLSETNCPENLHIAVITRKPLPTPLQYTQKEGEEEEESEKDRGGIGDG